MTRAVFDMAGDRLAVQLKVSVALVLVCPVAVGAAGTAWAVILEEGAV
jgi:hypothetical protein